MPIVKTHENEVEQRCAVCAQLRRVSHAELEAGLHVDQAHTNADVIALPTCVGCGAREFLIRTGPNAQGGRALVGSPDLHRELVNQLHVALVSRGRAVRPRDLKTESSAPASSPT